MQIQPFKRLFNLIATEKVKKKTSDQENGNPIRKRKVGGNTSKKEHVRTRNIRERLVENGRTGRRKGKGGNRERERREQKINSKDGHDEVSPWVVVL